MANLKTDSPLSRRIARSFLQFLNSVEPSPEVDSEALDVARECLAEVFKIDQSSISRLNHEPSLVDIFSLHDASARGFVENRGFLDATISSSGKKDAGVVEDEGRTREPHSPGKDELFGNFFGALEKIHYFRRMSDGTDDQSQLDRTTHLFHNAVKEMEETGCQTFDQKTLAETFKSQGNRFMKLKHYHEALELYTFAIAQCEDNAVYYCNRAAAFTQIYRYTEAIQDCLKSIEIDPNYSKAHSRLGFAYYAQGRYRDAIDKGFMKALQLDPNNDSIKENIQVAEQKLKEEQERGGPSQGSTSTSHEPLNHQPQFPSMPFNISGVGLPPDFTHMLRNFVPQNFQSGSTSANEAGDHNNEAQMRMDGNVNINLDQLPEELSGAFRSVMGMFPGAAPPGGRQQDNHQHHHGRPTSS